MLTIGHITYANCAPFFHFLAASGFEGEIVRGVPSELNALLSRGQLDICPSSSIEYARHAENYLLLPGQSISSVGPVQSVLLFSDLPMNALDGVPISITGESATSVALLQVMLREFFGLSEVVCRKTPLEPDVEVGESPLPRLLIGDRALKAHRQLAETCMVVDLGELWYHYTGLPFVFALWIINRHSAIEKEEEVREFCRLLGLSRKKAFNNLDEMARSTPGCDWMGVDGLVDYWRQVDYDLDPAHIEGLRCFYALLEKHALIAGAPDLRFFT